MGGIHTHRDPWDWYVYLHVLVHWSLLKPEALQIIYLEDHPRTCFSG